MSKGFRWFLRGLIYLPLLLTFYFFLRSYVGWAMHSMYDACHPKTSTMPDLASCMLQHKNNVFFSWIGKIDRYQYFAKPVLPCQFVGKWQAVRNNDTFYSILEANGRFYIENANIKNRNIVTEMTMDGYWSQSSTNHLIWLYPSVFVYPLDENPVKWLDADRLVIFERNDDKTYYRRVSEPVAGCSYAD